MGDVIAKRQQLYVCPKDNSTWLIQAYKEQTTQDFLNKLSDVMPCRQPGCLEFMVKNETLTVTLICTAGHSVGWPKDMFPRPERCEVILDIQNTVKEFCNQKMYAGFRLTEDYEDPNVVPG